MAGKRKEHARENGDVATTSKGDDDGEEPKRRKIEESTAELKGLDIYWKLSSINPGDREAATIALVKELQAAQKAYETSGKKLEEDILLGNNEKMQGCCHEIQYALPRLVRGVASSNQGARQGFSLALTTISTVEQSIKGDVLLTLIEDEIDVSSSMKSQDMKDGLLGRLFCYAAIIRAERFIGKGKSDEQVNFVQKITQELLKLGQKKSFLREAATCTLLELVSRLSATALKKSVFSLEPFQEWLKVGPEVGGADVLLLALKVWKFLPEPLLKDCTMLPNSRAEIDLFEKSNLEVILPYLKESSSSHPQVHPIWDMLATILSDESMFISSSKKSKRKGQGFAVNQSLVTFWNVFVDETLIFSSHERKHLAMRLVLLFLSKLPTSCIPIIISNAFGRCLIDSLAKPQNLLHTAAHQFLSDLQSWAEEDEDRIFPVIASLQQCSGGKFDHSTKTTTVRNLTSKIRNEDSCLSAIQNVRDMFLNETASTSNESEEEAKAVRKEIWKVELLCSFSKVSSASNSASREVLKFLIGHVLSSLESVNQEKLKKLLKWTPKTLSKPVQDTCVLKLRAMLAKGPAGKDGDGADDLAYFAVEFFRDALKPTRDEEEEDVQTALLSTISQLTTAIADQKATEKKRRYRRMRSLLSQLVIQSWLEPSSVDEVATELVICCKKAFGNVINVSLSAEEEDSEDAPPMMDVLLDVILSLQSQSLAPIRNASEQVFLAFSDDISASGINSMLKIVTKQLGNRVNEIFEAGGDFDDDDDDDDVVGIEDVSDDEKSEIAELESGSEEGQDNEASIQGAMDEAEASDLDDEAMFRIDSQLAGILKLRKKGAGDGQSQLVEFKIRVLGLLEKFLVKHPESPFLVMALPLLFQAHLDAGVGGNKTLANKIRVVIEKTLKAKSYPKGPDVDEAAVNELMPKLLTVVSRTREKDIRTLAQNFLFWLFKVRLASSESGAKDVGQIMSRAVELFFGGKKKSNIPVQFFIDAISRTPWLGRVLIGQLVEFTKTARDDYFKVQAMNVISHIFKWFSKPGVDSEFISALEKQVTAMNEVFVLYLNEPIGNVDRQGDFLKFCAAGLGALAALFPDRPLKKMIDMEALSSALSGFKASAKGRLKKLVGNIEEVLLAKADSQNVPVQVEKSNKRKGENAEDRDIKSPTKKLKTPKSKKHV